MTRLSLMITTCAALALGTAAAAHAQNAAQPNCGIETYSVDKQAYVGTPCPAGTTYENPSGKKEENFNSK